MLVYVLCRFMDFGVFFRFSILLFRFGSQVKFPSEV